MNCSYCGGPLESYGGEIYCPNCCRVEALELPAEADEEARRLRLAPAGPDVEGPVGDELPF